MTAQEMRATARELMELIRVEVANRRPHDGSRFIDLKRVAKRARSLLMRAKELDIRMAGGVA